MDPSDLEVRTSPAVAASYGRWSAFSEPLPDDALLAAFHSRDGEKLDVLVMRKREGKWGFWAFTPSGAPLPTNEARCRRCHQEAPADLVFGPPHPEPKKAEPQE